MKTEKNYQNRVTVNPTTVSQKVFQAFVESNMGMQVDLSSFSDTEKEQFAALVESGSF